jgi:hypothetical protein
MQSTKHFLKQQFQRLTLKPGAPIESPAVSAWSEIAGKMVDSFGEDKFALAVMRWLEQEQFFPQQPERPAEVPSHCPARDLRDVPRE